ncbi:Porphobilinogen deaminase, partial [Globisporangium splendens]
MDYDFEDMVERVCAPPSRPSLNGRAASETHDVTAAVKREVDRLAVAGTSTPQQIWDSAIKRIHRARAIHFDRDMHGRVEVPPLSNVRGSDLSFFQFQHVWHDKKSKNDNHLDRVIGWAHPALLNLLRYEKVTLFIDGTFRCVPPKFKQRVVVMLYDRSTKCHIPVFFVLYTSKPFDTYWNLLQFITNACGEKISPKEVICDFESALIQAVRDWCPETRIIGYLFHFKQACRRKMKKHRLPQAESSIAMEPGVLDMLTVVEQEKIPKQGVAWVKCKQAWIKNLSPEFWNVRDVRNDLVSRTDNPLERFNRELNVAFTAPHPSLPRFVQTIEELSRRFVRLRDDIASGRADAPKRSSRFELPQAVVLPDIEPASESSEDDECCSIDSSTVDASDNSASDVEVDHELVT